jgi:Holliday junction resolvasome RuvABC DNA-binding subunit
MTWLRRRPLKNALDAHTVENRQKRKDLQAQHTGIAKAMEALGRNAAEVQKAIQQLYASMESALGLAKHAETWSWKEMQLDSE